jgi:hypothetical protein
MPPRSLYRSKEPGGIPFFKEERISDAASVLGSTGPDLLNGNLPETSCQMIVPRLCRR